VRSLIAAFWLRALFRLAAVAPGGVRALRPWIARLAHRFSPKIRASTDANAARILGPSITPAERRAFGVGVVSSFLDFVVDVGRSSRTSPGELLERVESVSGLDAYRAARALGKGAIVVTAHMGSFEVGLAALAHNEPKPIHVVFKRDPFSAFERLRASLRQRLNVREAPVDDGWTMWIRLRDALLDDEVVCIQGDRVMPGQKGVRVPMLDGHVLLPSGPVKLALAAGGAPIVPIFSIRTPADRIRIFIEDAIVISSAEESDDAMRKLADVLARYVAAYPRQWLVLDKAFCEDVDE
jgi:KDO2-lipid IV(A) lauroyltransferase